MVSAKGKSTASLSVWAAMLSVYIIWGSTYLAIRFAVETIPAFLMAGVRNFTAGLILYGIMRLRGVPNPTPRQWRSAAIVGVLMLTGGNGLVSWAEKTVPSAITALLVGAVPLFMILIDWITGRYRDPSRRPNWLAYVGVVTGFGGIALLVEPDQLGGTQVDLIGAAALLVGALLWAGGSLYSREAALPESPLMGTSMEMLAGGVALLVIASVTGEWGQLNLATISRQSLLGMLYLIVFGSLVGFVCYTWLLRAAPTTLVSTYAYVNPVVAILLGVALGNEVISPRMLVAAAIILASVALITFTRAPARKLQPEVSGSPSD